MTRPAPLAAALRGSTALIAEAARFDRTAAFPVVRKQSAGMHPRTETAPEFVAVSGDGTTLVYSDSPLVALGCVAISDHAGRRPVGGAMVDGEPTAIVTPGGSAQRQHPGHLLRAPGAARGG